VSPELANELNAIAGLNALRFNVAKEIMAKLLPIELVAMKQVVARKLEEAGCDSEYMAEDEKAAKMESLGLDKLSVDVGSIINLSMFSTDNLLHRCGMVTRRQLMEADAVIQEKHRNEQAEGVARSPIIQ